MSYTMQRTMALMYLHYTTATVHTSVSYCGVVKNTATHCNTNTATLQHTSVSYCGVVKVHECHSALHRVALCCCVLLYVAICCNVLQQQNMEYTQLIRALTLNVCVCCSMLQAAVCCRLQYVAACCTVLHCLAVYGSVLQCIAM